MKDKLNRLVTAASRKIRRNIHPVPRREWSSSGRSGGKPTKLAEPFEHFTRVTSATEVVVCAMSSQPYATPAGFHIVRRDPADAPNEFNTDSYDEIDLRSLPQWSQIVSTARLARADADNLVKQYVFVAGPRKRRDHHSPRIPSDIAAAKPK